MHEMQNVFSTQFSQSRTVAFPRCLRRKNIISPYLKSPHISGVSCRLQTILVALQEKLQEEPAEVNKRTHVVRISNDETMKEMPRLIICHSGRKNKKKHTHTRSQRRRSLFLFPAGWWAHVSAALRALTSIPAV